MAIGETGKDGRLFKTVLCGDGGDSNIGKMEMETRCATVLEKTDRVENMKESEIRSALIGPCVQLTCLYFLGAVFRL